MVLSDRRDEEDHYNNIGNTRGRREQRRIREGEKTQPHIQPEMCHLSQVYQQQLQSELNSILLLLLVLVFFNIIIMLLPVLKKNVMR